jgi:hypothetical protein
MFDAPQSAAPWRFPGFAAVTTDYLLADQTNLFLPEPAIRSPYDLLDSLPSASDVISVDNYDPRSNARVFTDELTLEALHRLKIRPRDLYYPAPEDLVRIVGDQMIYRNRLVDRAQRLAQIVRAERDRLVRKKSDERSSQIRGVNRDGTQNSDPQSVRKGTFPPLTPRFSQRPKLQSGQATQSQIFPTIKRVLS